MAVDQSAVSAFLEVVAGESRNTAVQYLEATGWRVDDAVELFYAVRPFWGSLPPEIIEETGLLSSPTYPTTDSSLSPTDPFGSEGPGEDDGFSESSIQPHDEENSGSSLRPHDEENSGSSLRPHDEESLKEDDCFLECLEEDDGFPEPSIQPHDEGDEFSYQSQMPPIVGDDGNIPLQDDVTACRHYRECLNQDNALPPLPDYSHILPTGWNVSESLALSLPGDPTGQIIEKTNNPSEFDQETNTISIDSHDKVSPHPNDFMYYRTFHLAKKNASLLNKWLLVNVQPAGEQIVWVEDTVAQTIQSNFLFWQVTGESEEGMKVGCFYDLISLPVLLMIDPVTGRKMRAWSNMVEPERLLEDLHPFLDSGPQDAMTSTAVKKTYMEHDTSTLTDTDELISGKEEDDKEEIVIVEKIESIGMHKYPPLGEEPTGESGLVCRVAVRLPDGKRILRSFFREDPIQLLWSFCSSLLEEGLTRPFHFAIMIPGATKKQLEYSRSLNFEEACLSNSMLTLVWDQQLH